MAELLVAKIAKQLKTEVRASCTGTPEPQGKPWHAAIEREGTRYCCHYGHGDTAEEAVINALVENVHSLMLHKSANADLKLHLYTNNHTPVASDTLGNYTECTDASYGPIALVGGNWTIADNGSGVSLATYPTQTWTFAGAVTIFGYYVTDIGTSKVCWAEIFSAPLNFGAGQQLALTLNITLS